MTKTTMSHKDGVYLRYEDGHEEWFNGKNKKENVAGVAVHLGERHTCIAKFDVEDDDDEFVKEFPLLMNNNNDTEEVLLRAVLMLTTTSTERSIRKV